MPFIIKEGNVLVKCSVIWNKIKEQIGKKIHSELIYDDKFIKKKV